MKNFILIFALSAFTSIAAQNCAPNAVEQAFAQQYPTASSVKWKKEKQNFEAEFNVGDAKRSAVYDQKGRCLETEVDIHQNQLPKAAATYMRVNFGSLKITEVAKITDAKGFVTYEVEADGRDYIFDTDGKYLKIQ